MSDLDENELQRVATEILAEQLDETIVSIICDANYHQTIGSVALHHFRPKAQERLREELVLKNTEWMRSKASMNRVMNFQGSKKI